ncbi:hypothetical protein Mucpa_2432 [Mucilaginibacter paludis DSM 18603]|uniref:Uncharacterized protein n=1 Tax=Mucilaginibacter paludis DSM 18603 TaxID=714943 RepID=H1YII8_9SPHI|nr:hypothetical protein Mucpa_2432 [Mucilaginibacter paludis DSM 18603]
MPHQGVPHQKPGTRKRVQNSTGGKPPEQTGGTFGATVLNSTVIACDHRRTAKAASRFWRGSTQRCCINSPGVSPQRYSRVAEQALGLSAEPAMFRPCRNLLAPAHAIAFGGIFLKIF